MSYDRNQNNALYQLIRERAGTKMLREAEQVNIYNWIQELLCEGLTHDVGEQVEYFFKHYPPLAIEMPQGAITLSEVVQIDKNELEQLPWIYVDMLRTLAADDGVTDLMLDEMLKTSPAAAWREPLKDAVANKDIFEYTYTDWYKHNGHLVNSLNWDCKGISPDDEAAVEKQRIEDERFDRIQEIIKQRKEALRRDKLAFEIMQMNIAAFENDWDDRAFQEYDETSYGGCGCGTGAVGDCDCDYPMPALEPAVVTLPPLPSSPVATD
jgi:hypothetical protein